MLRSLVLAAMAVFGATTAIAAPKPPTVEQLAAYPAVSSFSLSPDGKYIAGLRGQGEDRVILVWEAADLKKAPKVLASKQMKIQSVQFIKNDLLAVSLWNPYDDLLGGGVTKTFAEKLFFVDVDGKNWREPMYQDDGGSQAMSVLIKRFGPEVLDSLPNDPDHVLVVSQVGTKRGDVFKVNVKNGRSERIQRTADNVSGYFTDLDGKLRGRVRGDVDGKGAYTTTELRTADGGWVEHFRTYVKDRDVTSIVGFTKDPNVALVLSNVGQDKAVVYEYDIAKRQMGEVLFKHPYFEANAPRVFRYAGPRFGEIVGLSYDGPVGGDVVWVDPDLKALDAALRQALNITPTPTTFVDVETGKSAETKYFSDKYYRIIDYSPDLKTVILSVAGATTPPSYYLFKNGELQLLSKAYPDIDPAALGTRKLVYYKARDGLDIPAFLTLPNPELCGPAPYRTVIHPHGGPWARDHMGFDGSMWTPLMASRCMAVLQPQYRGSDGWSRRLWKAGDAEWGQKMQDDKDDGAKWLIEQKIAQPGHIAMFGFSYGGYASMDAAVRPNGLYKCAIAGAGVSDIRRIWKDFYTNPYFMDAQGPTVKGVSPVDFADQIKIPIMVYHGERDRTVPIEQSEWFVNKAKKSGQVVEYHVFDDYDHGRAWTRKIMADQLRIIDDYFAKGCAGGL